MKYSYKGYTIVDVKVRGAPMKAVRYKVDGISRRKYFPNAKAAEKWVDKYIEAFGDSKQDLMSKYTLAQLDDIAAAVSMLPKGRTLLYCIKLAVSQLGSVKSVKEVSDEFLALKEGLVSAHYYSDKKSQLTRFCARFTSFEQATPNAIIDFCKRISRAPKTQRHYVATLKEFFDFAIRKDYLNGSPFDKIHDSEIPKLKRRAHKIASVSDVAELFEKIEQSAPELAGLYALVAFGGFRLAEAQRLTPASFNFERNEILLLFGDSKTGQTWLQSNMPDNVWTWVKAYPCNENWRKAHPDRTVKELKAGLTLERNALRHAFATYHLSLYRDAPKTQILMRHTSPAMLWQTYLAGLTSAETAKAYFDISPAL